ncbi:MAG: hypothetical protein ACRDLA_16605, partial [Thermoleophilaceae bacterium]
MGGFEIALGDRTQIDLLEEAAAALTGEDSLTVWVQARLSVALTGAGDDERRARLAEDAITTARRLGDDRALAYALAVHCDVIPAPEHADQRVRQSSEIVALATTARDPEIELLGRRLRLVALLEVGDVAGVDAEIEAYARVADLLRQPLFQWYVPLWRGMRALMVGDLERVEASLEEVSRIGQAAQSENARMMIFTQRAAVPVLLDRDVTDIGREFSELLEDHPSLWEYPSLPAMVAARSGREADARAILDRLAAADLRPIPRDAEWLEAMSCATDAAVLVRHRELARLLYDRLRPLAGRLIVDGIGGACLGAVDMCLGRLAALLGYPETERHFDDALALHRAAGATLLVDVGERHRAAAHGRVGGDGQGEEGEGDANVFQRDGDVWTLRYDGVTAMMKDAKGLRDLAALVARPGEMLHVRELLGAGEGHGGGVAPGADAVLDRRAVEEYRRRLRELEEEVGEAEADHDIERAARGKTEREAIVSELEAALGLGGRTRRLADETERARKAVRARIRLTLDRIDREHPSLGRHLRASVRTGTFCSYEPEHSPGWQL